MAAEVEDMSSKERLGDSDGHVHFPEDQISQHDSEIVVRPERDGRLGVHLGFLQVHHHYEISFSIKDNLNEDLNVDPLQNLNVKIKDVRPSEDGQGHDLVVDFKAYKEKLMKEELLLEDSTDSSKQIKLVLHARVLGKGKGTPSLRSGIHCVGIDAEEDSEHSDWQGFD